MASFNQGDVYSAVFDDPSPTDDSKMDAWLARAYAVMSSLKFDDSIADRVQNSGLTTHDSHYYYSDYLLHTDADTTKKEFWIRDKIIPKISLEIAEQLDQTTVFKNVSLNFLPASEI